MKVKTVRAFLAGGKLYEVGQVADFDARFAREIIHAGKAERVEEAGAESAPVTSSVLTTDTAGDLVKGKQAKGKT
jgi:hypothetical protein